MKILDKIQVDSPVTNPTQRVISCADFTGEISSKTGIIAKGIYIAKIIEQEKIKNGVKEHEVISTSPDIIIVCGIDCAVPCNNLYKKFNGYSLDIKRNTHRIDIPRQPLNIEPVKEPTPAQIVKKSKYF